MQVGYRTYLTFDIYYEFTILSLAIIEVTVVVDNLTGQVSFNLSMVCKSVDVI